MVQLSPRTLALAALMTAASIGALGLSTAQRTSAASKSNLQQELKGLVLARLEAYARGEEQKYAQFLSDDCLYTTDSGEVLTKEQLLHGVSAPSPGYTLHYEIDQLQLRELGNTAVLSFRLWRRDQFQSQTSQESLAHYRRTDVFAKYSGHWQLITSHSTAIPIDHTIGTVDREIYQDYIGVYERAETGTTTQITREGDKLIRQRAGRPKHELLPEWEDVFFIQGDPGLYIFMRNAKGRVSYLLYQSIGDQGRVQKVK